MLLNLHHQSAFYPIFEAIYDNQYEEFCKFPSNFANFSRHVNIKRLLSAIQRRSAPIVDLVAIFFSNIHIAATYKCHTIPFVVYVKLLFDRYVGEDWPCSQRQKDLRGRSASK